MASVETAVVRRAPGKAEENWQAYVRRQRLIHTSAGLLVPIVALIMWEAGARNGWFDTRYFASPSIVWNQAIKLIQDGTLHKELMTTVRRLLSAYVIGAALGILVGLMLSQFKLMRSAFEPTLRAAYTIPKLALLPIFLLIFGLGETPKLIYVGLGVFYIAAFTTLTAGSMVPKGYLDAARSFGLNRFQTFRWVIVPHSLPQIVDGLRLASGTAVLLVVAVEFLSARSGVGYMTWHAWELFQAHIMYVGIVTIAVMGVCFSAVIAAIGRRLVPWND